MIIEELSKKLQNEGGMPIVTNYRDAVNWLLSDIILCNNIAQIDESIFDNMEFDTYDDETGEEIEIYQYYLTGFRQKETDYLSNRFGLLFTYSNMLGCYVLCVPHYGTSWSYVYCDDNEKDEYWEKQAKTLL